MKWSRWPLAVALVLFATLVFADAPIGLYAVSSGTVTDMKTSLVWQQVDDGNMYDWASAKSHCTGLSSPGVTWRLPTAKELQTLVDDTRTNPSIDPTFTNTGANYYWSSSPVLGSPSDAWYVNFNLGAASYENVSNTYRVRCVR